jgi:accessory gene regulator B
VSEAKTRKAITEYICVKIIGIVGQGREISELDKKKLNYWVQMIYLNVTKVVTILIVAILLNVVIEALIIWFFFAMIKRTAFGIHAKSSLSCTITSVLIFDGGAVIGKFVDLPIYISYIIFIITFIIFILYAPADTEARPLVRVEIRRKFKKRTILTVSILFILAIVFGNNKMSSLLAISAMAEAISILPITYKIFKRRYGNYEYYKKCKR